MQVDSEIREITKRACIGSEGDAEAERLHRECSSLFAASSSFIRANGEPVDCNQLTRTDVAAMPPEEYQRYVRVAPLLSGDSTAFLAKHGEIIFETNAAGQFVSGSYIHDPQPRA